MAEENKQIQLELDDATSKGSYSNGAIIFHNDNEFVVDFAFIHPSKAKIVSRVIISPSHAKKLLKALEANIAQFEKKFGHIKDVAGPDQNMNIKLSHN